MNDRKTLALFVSTWLVGPLVAFGQTVAAGREGLEGRVTTLPKVEQQGRQLDATVGTLRLFEKSLDDTIEALHDQDLKGFVVGYRRMVRACGELSDHIGEAAELIGDSQVRVQLAKRSLDSLSLADPLDPAQRQKLVADVEELRGQLSARLAAAREAYRGAGEAERTKLLQQLAGLANRLEQVEQYRQSLAAGQQAAVGPQAVTDLKTRFGEVEQAIAAEQKALTVTAAAVKTVLEDGQRDMRMCLTMLEVAAQLPAEQLQQLSTTQQAVSRILQDVQTSRVKTSEAMAKLFGDAAEGADLGNADQVLQRVDRLLQAVNGEPSGNQVE